MKTTTRLSGREVREYQKERKEKEEGKKRERRVPVSINSERVGGLSISNSTHNGQEVAFNEPKQRELEKEKKKKKKKKKRK